MLLWKLIITACLMGSPSTCKETSYTYSLDKLTHDTCLREAEYLGDKWVKENPKYKLTRYKCTTTMGA